MVTLTLRLTKRCCLCQFFITDCLISQVEITLSISIKHLSANDTGASGRILYFIKIFEKLIPSITHTHDLTPSVFLTEHVSSHGDPIPNHAQFRYFGKTRNEKNYATGKRQSIAGY
ncbi:EcoRII N-terminal effector-binding domain-containing protein [Escherichia coli]